jgi:hypothetical protein
MWDLGIKARVPLPKKWQNYSSHFAQFVAFFSDDSKKETWKAEVYVRTYMNCCGSDCNRTVRPWQQNNEGQYINFPSNHKDR